MVELKGDFFNKEEIRSHDTRLSYINTFLPKLIETAKIKTLGFKENLEAINPKDIKTVEDLQKIPVLRKSELSNKQKLFPPFGGFERTEQQNTTHFFQSPGPIYEPGTRGSDWGRFAPFLYATGVRKGSIWRF